MPRLRLNPSFRFSGLCPPTGGRLMGRRVDSARLSAQVFLCVRPETTKPAFAGRAFRYRWAGGAVWYVAVQTSPKTRRGVNRNREIPRARPYGRVKGVREAI